MDRHEDTKTRRKESLFLIWCFRGVTVRGTPGSLFVASCLRGLPILALLAISVPVGLATIPLAGPLACGCARSRVSAS